MISVVGHMSMAVILCKAFDVYTATPFGETVRACCMHLEQTDSFVTPVYGEMSRLNRCISQCTKAAF